MSNFITSLFSAETRATNIRVQKSATQDTLKRMYTCSLVVFGLNLGYAIWFLVFLAPDPSTEAFRKVWLHSVGWIHVVTGLCMLLLAYIGRMLINKPHPHKTALMYQLIFGITICFFGVALSIVDQWVSSNTTMFAVTNLAVAMLSLLRPGLALAQFLVSYSAVYIMLPWTQIDTNLVGMNRSHALGTTFVCILASVIVWRQYANATLLRWEIADANKTLSKQQEELKYLATHDVLTGLYNRREFMRVLEHHVAPESKETSLIMIDLDYFKRINDTHGHPAGDAVLQQVAAALKKNIRSSDIIARLGGEEFIIMLPATTRSQAAEVAELLRLCIRNIAIVYNDITLPVTASFGVSSLTGPLRSSVDELYLAADKALYAAKELGRDRVSVTT